MRKVQTEAVALINTVALATLVANHFWYAGPLYFWLGIALIAVTTAGLTRWGERLR